MVEAVKTSSMVDVAVIIPTHKRAKALARAVASVISQTAPCKEVIVVSDGIDLETNEVMQSLQEGHSNIQYYIVDPPMGANHARNIGIMRSRAKYVAFLDDDDEWISEKIEMQLAVMKENPSIGLVCTAAVITSRGRRINRTSVPTATFDSSQMILKLNCIGTTSSVLVKRKYLQNVGMFDEQLPALQDYDLWIRICQITGVGVVEKPCVVYHDEVGSNQISSSADKYEMASTYLYDKYEDLYNRKLNTEELRDVVGRSFLSLSLRFTRNRHGEKARSFARKAIRKGQIVNGILCYVFSFLPYSFLMRLYGMFRT